LRFTAPVNGFCRAVGPLALRPLSEMTPHGIWLVDRRALEVFCRAVGLATRSAASEEQGSRRGKIRLEGVLCGEAIPDGRSSDLGALRQLRRIMLR
jgi:hypothetical protein